VASTLKTVVQGQGATAALRTGAAPPAGFSLEIDDSDQLVVAFRRMVRELAYDVAEMAFTTYLCAKEQGKGFTALPVFLVREFHHDAIAVDSESEIAPRDLEGRSVGVNRGYTVTRGVWARGVLETEYGVDLSRVTWRPTSDEHVAEYRPPRNVVPLESDADLLELLSAGKLAGAVGATGSLPGIAPLIPNPAEAGFAALASRGHYPINHLVVVRDELLDAHPELAAELFAAFAESKQQYLSGELTPLHARVAEITGGDPLPYGVEPNRGPIEELLDHAVSQRLLRRRPAMDEIFAPGTLDLDG
jgi:4,5-dihydroxyphthalate decarboxylase